MKPYRDPQISTEEMNTYDLMYRGIPALDHNVNKTSTEPPTTIRPPQLMEERFVTEMNSNRTRLKIPKGISLLNDTCYESLHCFRNTNKALRNCDSLGKLSLKY